MKTKKKKTIKERVKAIIQHFYEDDAYEETVNPKLRLATKS
jgi:hypothetical protein